MMSAWLLFFSRIEKSWAIQTPIPNPVSVSTGQYSVTSSTDAPDRSVPAADFERSAVESTDTECAWPVRPYVNRPHLSTRTNPAEIVDFARKGADGVKSDTDNRKSEERDQSQKSFRRMSGEPTHAILMEPHPTDLPCDL